MFAIRAAKHWTVGVAGRFRAACSGSPAGRFLGSGTLGRVPVACPCCVPAFRVRAVAVRTLYEKNLTLTCQTLVGVYALYGFGGVKKNLTKPNQEPPSGQEPRTTHKKTRKATTQTKNHLKTLRQHLETQPDQTYT